MVLLSPYPKNEWSENTTSKCLYKLCISNKIKQSRNTLEKLIFLNMGKKLTSFILKPWDALYSRFSILSMIQNPLELLIRDMTLWASPLEYPGAGRAGSIQSQCQRNSRKSLQISKEILIYQLKTWGSVLQKNSRMLLLNSCHPHLLKKRGENQIIRYNIHFLFLQMWTVKSLTLETGYWLNVCLSQQEK